MTRGKNSYEDELCKGKSMIEWMRNGPIGLEIPWSF